MINMEYKFNNSKGDVVKIFLPEEEIDKDTIKQIKAIVENPSLKHVRFMPDAHKGNGCCIGLTSIIDKGLIPNYVGGDIGCGISIYSLNVEINEKKYSKIEKMIKDLVPMGQGNINKLDKTREEDWVELYEKCNKQINNLYNLYPNYEKISYDNEWYSNFSKRVKTNIEYDIKSIGTLGSGNHYIEINVNSENKAYITVHSGSRNLGQKVCNYHQSILNSYCKFNWNEYNRLASKISKKIKGEERKVAEDKIFNEIDSKVTKVPYLENEKMFEYLVDMIFAQNYASLNRKIMLRDISEGLGHVFDEIKILETIHNYIDFDKMIIRKGAISADKDELCIISLNMRDGILICKGKGNKDWNYSSAHGCGRVLNRSDGSKLSLKEFQKEMEDVYSTSINKETLDESPMVYKDVKLIKECLDTSVEILEQLKPIINCKGF